MSFQYFVVAGALATLLIFLIQKLFSTKSGFWKQYGIEELKATSYLFRILKNENFYQTFGSLYKQLGDSKFGGMYDSGHNVLFVKDLDLIKQMFVKDFDHFTSRGSTFTVESDEAWNQMLVNKEGKEWKDLRATMSPAFTSGKLRRMFPMFQESGNKFNDYIVQLSKQNTKLDITDAMGRYTLDGIISLAFGVDSEAFKNENSVVVEKAKNMMPQFSPLTFFKMTLFSMMPRWVGQTFQPPFLNPEATTFFMSMIKKTITHREKTGERRNDFLQLLLDAKHGQLKKDEDDGELASYEKDAQLKDTSDKDYVMTDDLIAANCMIVILGGYETTKTTIVFALYAMAVNQDVQEKLRTELQEAMEENGGQLSYDVINTHEYLDKVMNEVLRVYPPGLRMERLCTKDYPIPGTKSFIPKDAYAYFPIYEIHYDEKHYPNPNKFDPERFSPEVKATRHPYAYMPFGHGPRNCIANRFALVMTKAYLANIILNFFVEPTAETSIPLKFKNDLTLVPTEPIQLKLTPIK